MKAVVERMDLLSRKRYPKARLFRLVKENDVLIFDGNQDRPGRGYYLLKDEKTLQALKKKNVLLRFSKKTDYEALLEQLEEALHVG